MIAIGHFKEVEMRVGLVVEAVDQPGSEKLIKLTVDFGLEIGVRIIFTAVRPFGYTPDYFIGKKWLFVTNVEPKKIMGEESQGMILAVDPSTSSGQAGSGQAGKPVFVVPAGEVEVGAKIR